MLALADCRISAEIEESISAYADEIIKLPPHKRLSPFVASHPDMLTFTYKSRIFTWEEYLARNEKLFRRIESFGYTVEPIKERASEKYPDDVRLNCALVGNTLIANGRAMSEALSELAKREGLRLLHTKQGYSKCSTAVVSDSAVITADASVYSAAVSAGIDALRIREGHVRLDGYATGFIGGASGACEDKLLFCGDLSSHPDGERIAEFCKAHGKEAVSLSSEPLYDYGTVFFLP